MAAAPSILPGASNLYIFQLSAGIALQNLGDVFTVTGTKGARQAPAIARPDQRAQALVAVLLDEGFQMLPLAQRTLPTLGDNHRLSVELVGHSRRKCTTMTSAF